MNFIDNFLNRTTMYRLVLYYLVALWLIALIFSITGILHYSFIAILFSAVVILFVCWVVNTVLAQLYKIPTNVESVYITAFILMFLITPLDLGATSFGLKLLFMVLASAVAIASKFVVAIRRMHIFNPAAFGVAAVAFFIAQSASWWIGTKSIALPVLLGGILVARKLIRWDLVGSFFITVGIMMIGPSFLHMSGAGDLLRRVVLDTPLLFFGFVMLTEPLTTPPTRAMRIFYTIIVGVLFVPGTHIGSIYFSPELALVAGNIFSYIVSPKAKPLLTLKEKIKIAPDMYDFLFVPDRPFEFKPGQYLEWTLAHTPSDSRGNRRYFTIASSPSEPYVRLGVKFYEPASTFKKALLALKPGAHVVATQLAGEFVLPFEANEKLVFIAGGIGITPFRSIVQDMLDFSQKRNIVLLYSGRTPDDIVYRDVFDVAETRELGLRTIYTVTNVTDLPDEWPGRIGFITPEMILEEIPDYRERTFYISGPRSMVLNFQAALRELHVPHHKIKIDFFPGFA